MKQLILICTATVLLAGPMSAQDDWKRDSIPPEVYTQVDEIALYPGGMDALDAFFKQNFVYPTEAWLSEERYRSLPLRFIIRADGVACGLQQDGMHPALYKELKRVFAIMPKWQPAQVDGRPVDAGYSLSGTAIPLYDIQGTGQPFHINAAMKALNKYTEENKRYGSGLKRGTVDNIVEKGTCIGEMAPDNVDLMAPLARMLAANGKYDQAMTVADRCAETYHDKSFIVKPDTLSITTADIENEADERTRLYKTLLHAFNKVVEEKRFNKMGYDGKDDMHAALTYAWICDAAESKQRADSAYRHALKVIDGRIMEQDVRTPVKYHENREYLNLMKEKLILTVDPKTSGVQLDRSDIQDILEAHTYGASMAVIDRKIKEGKISNARILQITKQLSEIRLNMNDHRMGKDSLHHYGLRALALYLSQGMDAQRHYMEDAGSQSKELKEYFDTMSDKMQKHSAELSDRDAVLRSLACFAPINQEGDSKEEKKQRAKEFYKYRDAVKEVYPLEWLWE